MEVNFDLDLIIVIDKDFTFRILLSRFQEIIEGGTRISMELAYSLFSNPDLRVSIVDHTFANEIANNSKD